MNEELYEIAAENLRHRRKAKMVMIAGVALFIGFFSYWLSTGSSSAWPWFFIVPIAILTIALSSYYTKKIIGKKHAVTEEMDRLKNALDGDSDDKLELKRIIPRYRDEDLV